MVVVDGRGTAGPRPGLGARGPGRPRHAGRSTTRSTPCTRSPPTIPTSTSTRVGIRGWSFGGYLAALAVLRRPDVFHAAVAGAPVTDWRSTTPTTPSATSATRTTQPEPTRATRCSPTPAKLTRPLLLIHGLADDNVVAAHTLRLSSALLAAGRPHRCCRCPGSPT